MGSLVVGPSPGRQVSLNKKKHKRECLSKPLQSLFNAFSRTPLWSMGAAKDQTPPLGLKSASESRLLSIFLGIGLLTTPPHSAQAEEFQFLRFGNPSALLHLLERTVELPLARVQPLL